MIGKITIKDSIYPLSLKRIKNPPEELHYRGDLSLLEGKNIALVGSRRTTAYGRGISQRLAEELGKNRITVVSGLAMGVDACAHQGALHQPGRTIAVLGCGIQVDYPVANRELKKAIEEKGLVLSEFDPDFSGSKYSFPLRNRIISGLSQGVIVTEAGVNSGALITASLAIEQGKNVYAVPNNITSQYGLGANQLLRDGAIPLLKIEDLLEDFSWPSFSREEKITGLGKREKQIIEILYQGGESSFEELARVTETSPEKVVSMVTVLEIKGLVHVSLGKVFIAK